MCNEGLNVVIGCGKKFKFWQDISVESSKLKKAFLRIFALATVKDGFISDFGFWRGDQWVYKVDLQREPLDWEKDQ